jgi:hypothetical protein
MSVRRVGPILLATAALLLSPTPLAHAWEVADSGCVQSGQTPEYCIGKFMESINSINPVTCDVDYCQPRTINNGLIAVDAMMRSFNPPTPTTYPPKKMFADAANKFKMANDWATDEKAVFFVQMAIHWFGPPGLEDQVRQAMTS